VNVNITLALDDEVVARVRAIAQKEGLSLNELVRRHLEMVAGRRSGAAVVSELRALWATSAGRSGGRKIERDEAYEGRV